MDVLVGVFGQEFFMGFHGVVDFDFGGVSVATEASLGAVRFGESDDEVVDVVRGFLRPSCPR